MATRVLVTGAAGSLGRRLCASLLRQGHHVRALDVPLADFGPLAATAGVERALGDVRDPALAERAVAGIDWVLHLAAILPPASEGDRERAVSVNVGGTISLLDALAKAHSKAPLALVSSVAAYGDTSDEEPPLTTEHPQHPLDVYGESKRLAEAVVRRSGRAYTILRVAGIAVPSFLEPPEPWPFTAQQRLEFVNRDDVVTALVNCVGNRAALGRTLHVAGGGEWRMHGHAYAGAFYEAYGLPLESASFQERPGPYDWYETADSQRILGYQQTTFARFTELLHRAVEEAFA